jgi:hydroxymethylbilane synthase
LPAAPIRIGTRGSPLALAQAREVRGRLMASHGLDEARIEIVVVRTSGDRIQDRPLAEAGGKGLFTKEIEDALLSGGIDLAVHSMKDVPTELPPGLAMAAILEREDVRDAFVSLHHRSLAAMPAGARVGTSSLRRAAQVLHVRPDLVVVPFRGNVETRLAKLADGVADATLLACAGLNRLGLAERIAEAVGPEQMLPAVAQGAIGVEIRGADAAFRALVGAIDHAQSALTVAAERAFLARLEGSCRTPIAALATFAGANAKFVGEILSVDGRHRHQASRIGSPSEIMKLAVDAAQEIKERAGPAFLQGGR